jgi:predicted PurR-regulated permease PerM
MDRDRQRVLGGLFVALCVAAVLVLGAVLDVVIFAITVAYVLYPIRQRIAGRGLPDRLASAVATTIGFLFVVVLFAPLAFVVYRRRSQLLDAVAELPETVDLTVGSTELTIETGPIVETASDVAQQGAIDTAVAVPRLALELTLFTILVYAILYRPIAVRTAARKLVPDRYHDVVLRLHGRVRTTLFSIYVLQATTAAATFGIALVLFLVLGYAAPVSLAVVAGILQFVPIVGPSVLLVLLAGSDVLIGNPARAASVLLFGLTLVAFLPDAVIRTKLAGWTGEIAPSLYFVGFVGGILTVGPIGIIVGPLVVALLAEVVLMLSEREVPEQTTLE